MRLWIVAVFVLAAILIPFFLWEPSLSAWTQQRMQMPRSRPTISFAVAGLLAADLFLPVPSSVVATAAGALLGFPLGVASSFAGMSAGCLLGYLAGAGAGGIRFLNQHEMSRLESASKRYGHWLLILFRAVPVLAEASVVYAGLSRIPLPRFLLLTSLSNIAICSVYSATGAWAAKTEMFFAAFAGSIVLPALAMWLSRRRHSEE